MAARGQRSAATEALELRHRIDRLGGLIDAIGLAERWGISPSAVRLHAKHKDFPTPVAVFRNRRVWTVRECDEWRRTDRVTEHFRKLAESKQKGVSKHPAEIPLGERMTGEFTFDVIYD